MKVDPSQDPTNGAPLTLRLLPVDEAERGKLADLRRAIADVTKVPIPKPDTYRFHISLGYFVAWLTAAEQITFARPFNRWAQPLASKRSEESRVGKECVIKCNSRRSTVL